jgi:hypothetical protein
MRTLCGMKKGSILIAAYVFGRGRPCPGNACTGRAFPAPLSTGKPVDTNDAETTDNTGHTTPPQKKTEAETASVLVPLTQNQSGARPGRPDEEA